MIQGLCESAIYGGRVDSIYDLQVLSAYLQLYFDSTVFKENQPLAPGIYVPVSSKFSVSEQNFQINFLFFCIDHINLVCTAPYSATCFNTNFYINTNLISYSP